MAPPPRDPRALPSKEEGLFKTLMSQYETKNWKKAIKTADTILKKFPDHGQTISMKGLVVFHAPPSTDAAASPTTRAGAEAPLKLTPAEEGLELAKLGVRKDLKSQLCWHVLGMLHRSMKQYTEASRAFAAALRCDPNSIQILRDSATLNLHLRQYSAHLTNRIKIMSIRPNERKSWVALAIAFDLDGQKEEAVKTLEGFYDFSKDIGSGDYEWSELGLYMVKLLIEVGKYEQALGVLERGHRDRVIVDREAALTFKAEILHNLGKVEESEDVWRTLLEQNADNYKYYYGFLKNKNLDLDTLTPENQPKALKALSILADLYPRAPTPRRIALKIASADSEEFRPLVRAYFKSGLERGVPSLFADLKAIYKDSKKRDIVGEIAEEFKKNLETTGNLEGDANSETSQPQPPTTLLWLLYFMALHYSSPLSNPKPNPTLSLLLLEQALAHTPTLPELYMAKARVLKYAGAPLEAAKAMESARVLDLQDRFLNSKAAKYWLRAGESEKASNLLGLFTKKDALSPGADLVEMQCLWFLTEDGDREVKDGKLNKALKRYNQIEKVFDEMDEDQFDFHSYCFRKFTLRAYYDMVAWENKLRRSTAYTVAALESARIYVRVHDEPALVQNGGDSSDEGLSAAEKKKAQQKAKKAALKAQENAKKAGATAAADKKPAADASPVVKDDDPNGDKLLTAAEPLEKAHKLVVGLGLDEDQKSVEVWMTAYEIEFRRRKFLAALRCLKHAHTLEPAHPDVFRASVHLKTRVIDMELNLDPSVVAAMKTTFNTIYPESQSPRSFITSFLQAPSLTAAQVIAAALSLVYLASNNDYSESIDLLLTIHHHNPVISDLSNVKEYLRQLNCPTDKSEAFFESCKKLMPLATLLQTEEVVKAKREEWLASETAPVKSSLEEDPL